MNRHWGETLIFVCFVLVATALWYGHAMTSVRTEVVPVHVQYSGVDSRIAFNDSLPSTLNVEIRDAGQRIKTYFRDSPTITIDLQPQLAKNEGSINITEEQLRISVNSVLQGTSKLLTIDPATIHSTFYRQSSKQVPVILQANISPAKEYQFALRPTLNEPTIDIFGAPTDLECLDTIYTQPYQLADLKDTLIDQVALILPEGVRAQADKVTFMAVTERFTEKVFTLPITYQSPDSTLTLRLFPAEAAVTVRCAIRDFNSVEASDISLTCAFPKTKVDRLRVKASTTNKKITMMRVHPAFVEYIVEQQ